MGAIRAQEARDFEFSSHDLLVQVRSFWVFKGEKATDHRVENDTTAPNITLESKVLLTGDHLWRSVAG